MSESTTLGFSAAQLEERGARFTAREIAQQPKLWPQVARLVRDDRSLPGFLRTLFADPALRVMLTGAGTSGYIGECLAPALGRRHAQRVEAIATTDIVASPGTWLSASTPTLLVSFARSGNSPESVAAVELADRLIERCAHLIVTCNDQGELYRRAQAMRDTHVVLLPEAANDQSFAMTSSFTAMLLAAGSALGAARFDQERVARLSNLGGQVLGGWLPRIQGLVGSQFDRVVYLGSTELEGLASESALKMLELSDGRVVSLADSPMGFRHGPKTILNERTLVVLFVSNDAHTRRYELDLLEELRRDRVAGRVIAVSNQTDLPAHADTLILSEDSAASERLDDLELCLPYVVFAQSLAMLRSLSLGLSPDKPNAAGTVNRVVQGVSIHPYGQTR
jgi:D-galactosamine 6-phosphate deaminase/isomerase